MAALLVAVHHLPSLLKPDAYITASRPIANLGEIGVTAFFVLSGLLISHTVARKSRSPGYTFREYFIERCVRIYLVFLPALLLIVVAGLISSMTGYGADYGEWRKFDLWHFSTNLMMLSGVRHIVPHLVTFSFMEQSWTLNYEFFFYILFGVLVLPVRAGLVVRVAIFTVVLLVTLQLPRAALLVLALSWGLGVLASRLLMAETRSSGYILALAAAILVAVIPLQLGHTGERIPLVLFIAAGILCLVASSKDMNPPTWLILSARTLAGFSYSLYLLHLFLYWVFYGANPIAVEWAIATIGVPATAVALLVIVNVGAWVFSLGTERHTNLVRRALLLMRLRTVTRPHVE